MKYLNKFACLASLAMVMTACGGEKIEPVVDPPTTPDPPTSTENVFEATIGEPLKTWTPGTMDIHAISTGRGDCFLYIFPDGTSMMVDAAGSLITQAVVDSPSNDQDGGILTPRPSADVSSSSVIAKYVEYFNPHGKTVDYWLNTHFDADHMGHYPPTYAAICPVSANIKKHSEGGFYLNGINELGTLLNYKKLVDRGYTAPIDLSSKDRFIDYKRFIDWTAKSKGTVHEVAKVGSTDQFVLNYDAMKYSNFKIRVLSGSGYYWTGQGDGTMCNLPLGSDGKPDQVKIKKADPKENIYSVSIMIEWGKFNTFNGGDLICTDGTAGVAPSEAWLNAEAPVAKVVDRVEVMIANHHGIGNANSYELLNSLKPATVIVTPWRDAQPKAATMDVMAAAVPSANIFSTDITANHLAKLSKYPFQSHEGHVVVRIDADGKYKVFTLDNANYSYKVTGIFGPYKSN